MNFSFDLRFMEVPKKEISLDSIKGYLNSSSAKRIHFATTHSNALKEKNGKYTISLPFADTIQPLLLSELGWDKGKLFSSKFEDGKFYRIINSDEELKGYQDFIRKYQNIVFLRDNLELSIALDMNFTLEDSRSYTEIGELEYKAKYEKNQDAISRLIKLIEKSIKELPFLHWADVVCAMPQKRDSETKLPKIIVNSLDLSDIQLDNISDKVWLHKKEDLKNCDNLDSKLDVLQESTFEIDPDVDLKGKTVLLVDDLYKSGASMNFVAMKLKEAGASRVFGLAIVKSLGNS